MHTVYTNLKIIIFTDFTRILIWTKHYTLIRYIQCTVYTVCTSIAAQIESDNLK